MVGGVRREERVGGGAEHGICMGGVRDVTRWEGRDRVRKVGPDGVSVCICIPSMMMRVRSGREIGRGWIEDLIVQHAHVVLFGESRLGVEGGGRELIEVEGMGISRHSTMRYETLLIIDIKMAMAMVGVEAVCGRCGRRGRKKKATTKRVNDIRV